MAQPTPNGVGGISGIMDIRLRDMTALIAAQTAMIGGMADLLGRCQIEAMRAVMSTVTAIPWSDPPKDPAAGITLLFDTMKNASLDGAARSNALTEIASRAGAEVGATLNTRWLSCLDEWKAVLTAAAGATGPA